MTGPYHYETYRPPQEPPPMPVVYRPQTDQQPISTTVVVVSWIVTVFTALYFLPWAIAASRGKSSQWTVFAVNLLLGWTFVGWIVALVLACTAHGQVPSAPAGPIALPLGLPPAGWYPNPDGGQARQYWDGRQWTQHYE